MRRTSIALVVALASSSAMAQAYNAPFRPIGWRSVGSLLTAGDGNAGTTWAPVTSAALEFGNVAVCVVAKDETGGGTTDGTGNAEYTSATDAASNTWTEAYEWCNMQTGTVANGACVAVYYTVATATLASGAAITFTFAGSTTRKAIACWEFSKGGTVSVAAGSNGLANDAADPGSMTAATTVARLHLFIRASSCESNSTAYTVDTDYTTFTHTSSVSDSGTAATSMGARGEFRIADESTSAASDPTYASADCASAMVTFDE